MAPHTTSRDDGLGRHDTRRLVQSQGFGGLARHAPVRTITGSGEFGQLEFHRWGVLLADVAVAGLVRTRCAMAR
jgi:hypothetical protein